MITIAMEPKVCPTCGAVLLPPKLHCQACLEKQSREMLREYQKRLLPGILHGTFSVILAQKGYHGTPHLALVGGSWTWCGKSTLGLQRHYQRWSDELLTKICAECRREFEKLAGEQAS
jgi:hypothetical protein